MVLRFDSEYFSVKDTLCCGQIFRFFNLDDNSFSVISGDKIAVCRNENGFAVVECKDDNALYFENFFDIKRDYSLIVTDALKYGVDILDKAVIFGKGIRILKQDYFEVLISFVISQNNNIPRIQKTINALCENLGEKITFNGLNYYGFPSIEKILSKDANFYKGLGLGYRAEYILSVATAVKNGEISFENLKDLPTYLVKKQLLKVKGIGPKVADCVTLFGLNRADSFPVDTWIEKIYREDFLGKETDRNKITEYFLQKFGLNAGYIQQYLFHYKRNFEKTL